MHEAVMAARPARQPLPMFSTPYMALPVAILDSIAPMTRAERPEAAGASVVVTAALATARKLVAPEIACCDPGLKPYLFLV